MTKLLLDTCAILFLSVDDARVTADVRRVFTECEEVYVSAITVAELACLSRRGRIDLGMHWKPWFRNAVKLNQWQVLPVTWEVMEEAYSLPDTFHADPVDRIFVATSRIHKIPLLTPDRKILAYPHVEAFWDGD
mgnify:CR=1 FL=1